MLEPLLDLLAGGVSSLDPSVPLQSESNDLEDWQVALLAAGMCFPVGVVSFKLGLDRYRRSRIVRNTATERMGSMAVGRTELNGVARPFDGTHQQPFETGECVYGTWRILELREKKPHDDEDNEQTWETVASGTVGDRFVLEDDTGAVTVDQPSTSLSRDLTDRTTVKGSQPPTGRIAEFLEAQDVSPISSNRRRYVQNVIPEGRDLYVLGQAAGWDAEGVDPDALDRVRETYDGFVDELVIERDEGSGEFVVTDRDEGEFSRYQFLWTLAFLLGGLVFVAAGAGLLGLGLQQYGIL